MMNKEARIKILQDIVKIKSVNDNEKDVADYLEKLFTANSLNNSYFL